MGYLRIISGRRFVMKVNQAQYSKPGRGGARPGAGRPAGSKSQTEANRRIRFQIRLPRYVVEWLRGQDRSAGRIIEAALKNKYIVLKGATNGDVHDI